MKLDRRRIRGSNLLPMCRKARKGKIIELPTRQSRITQLRQREALLEMRISDKCREEIDELMLIDEELEELQNDNNNSQI